MIRVVVVDDHLFYREGIRTLLGDFGDTEVVGEAAHGEDVMDLLAQVEADVVLLDLGLPGRSGLSLLPDIKSRWPDMAVVVVTMDDEDSSVRAALQRGAAGYLLKDASAGELYRALTAAVEGQFTLSASLSARIPRLMGAQEHAPAANAVGPLSPRERSMLGQLARGRSNEEMARSFGVSTKTVRNQLSLLYTKLAVTDRSQAVLMARDLGFG